MKPTEAQKKVEAEPKNYKFKATFMGNAAVGKSAIISQLCLEVFPEAYKSTLGCEFYTKVITAHFKISHSELNSQKISLSL